MKVILFTLVIVAAALADVQVGPEPAPPEPTRPPTTTTPTTAPTTTSPKTTSPTTTSSTTTSSTTTSPTTTTPITTTSTTTTKTTTGSTTVKPNPTPTPESKILNFTITDNKNKTCIMLCMQAEFHVPYKTKNGTKEAKLPIPHNATATGVCGDKEQNITISWAYDSKNTDTLSMVFKKNDTTKKFMVASTFGVLFKNNAQFPNATDNETIHYFHNHSDFVTPLKMSYKCKKEESLNLTMIGVSNETASFVVSNLQMEAFSNSTGHSFSSAEDCEFETSGIVPIAVGCSLAALIIIVLIAYLVGRRRSQARGYLSM